MIITDTTLAGTLPAGHRLILTAVSEDARGNVKRLDHTTGDEIKHSELMGDPVPYVFGPFNKGPVNVRITCLAGSYSLRTDNEREEPAPEFTAI